MLQSYKAPGDPQSSTVFLPLLTPSPGESVSTYAAPSNQLCHSAGVVRGMG